MAAAAIRRILATTDFGETSDEVLRQAGALAVRAGAELHILHVEEMPRTPRDDAAPKTSIGREALQTARDALEGQVRRCLPALVPTSQEVLAGAAHGVICRRAAELSADVVLVGPNRGGTARAHFLGTTADRVIRTVHVPCLVVRAPIPLPLQRIGVPTDLSKPAGHALRVGIAWSRILGATGETDTPSEVRVIHTGWPVYRDDDPSYAERVLQPSMRAQIEEALASDLADVGDAESRTRAPNVSSDVVWANKPAEAIVAWTRKRRIDLLVMGSEGLGGVRRALLGSTASAVSRQAPCSVLIVPYPLRAGEELPCGDNARQVQLAKVVVGVDFGEPSLAAAEWTVRHFASGAVHTLVHALDMPRPSRFVEHFPGRADLLARATEGAASRLERLREEWAAPDLRTEVREGKPAAVLAEIAGESGADLVVVGEHTHPRGTSVALGTTAENLVRCAPVPVLVARGVRAGAPERILVAVDDSDDAAAVLAWGRFLGLRFGARVTTCHVFRPLTLGVAGLVAQVAGPLDINTAQRERAEAWLGERVREADFAAGEAEIAILAGEPAFEILAAERRGGFDLIVLGSRGGGAVARALLGSVATAVLRGAACPVFVVRGNA